MVTSDVCLIYGYCQFNICVGALEHFNYCGYPSGDQCYHVSSPGMLTLATGCDDTQGLSWQDGFGLLLLGEGLNRNCTRLLFTFLNSNDILV